MERFKGRSAVVTGAASGIGQAIAVRLLAEGARVALLDRNESVVAVASELSHRDALGIVVDVRDEASTSRAFEVAVGHFGGVDVLCTAAGILKSGDVLSGSLSVWDETMDVNLRGQLLCVRAALPLMQERGRGSIVMVSSISARVGDRGVAAYAASKAGVTSLAMQIAAEMVTDQIRCNVVVPGWIDTPFNDVVFADASERAFEVRQTVPMRREGVPAEVAAAAAFLASDDASYITGASLLVDGGLLMGIGA
jgi:meso-butanediol dehydrogenase / (S,S)-butanediol dehydrogenase / diacetyl reductase